MINCPLLDLPSISAGLRINVTRTLYSYTLTSQPDATLVDVPPGTIVFFYCDQGYELSGYSTLYCKGSGDGLTTKTAVWSAAIDSAPFPTCLRMLFTQLT